MSKTIENLKSGNYEVVDNQGVSVTQHFIECLEKEFADIEAKLAEKEKEIEYQENMKILAVDNQNKKAIEQLEKVKEWLEPIYFDYEQIDYLTLIIDQQINELKGEKL